MRATLSVFVGLCFGIILSACGTEEDWANVEMQSGQDIELTVGQDTSELTVEARTRYECICDLSNHTCHGEYRFPQIKKNTCRYKRRKRSCVGGCIGRCVNQDSGIKRRSEFKGTCFKREVRPNGLFKETATDCKGNDIECSEVIEDTTDRSIKAAAHSSR